MQESANARRDGRGAVVVARLGRSGLVAPVHFASFRGMAKDILAHITGTVWKIEVSAGDAVETGQTLVILESMKMELPVEATSRGTVSKIHVSEGDAVKEGQALLTLT